MSRKFATLFLSVFFFAMLVNAFSVMASVETPPDPGSPTPTPAPVDTDGDGIYDNVDNCVFVRNVGQADWNSNGIGNKCDDGDHDGLMDLMDNCMRVYNPDQRDTDVDGIGDACDTIIYTGE